MDLELLRNITGFSIRSARQGYIYGNLYEVTDYTEPRGIYKYPLLIAKHGLSVVICIEVVFKLGYKNLRLLERRLKSFEGELYHTKILEFHAFTGGVGKGISFVGKLDAVQGKSNIKKIDPISNTYLWNYKERR
jgi:hypothetical protein